MLNPINIIKMTKWIKSVLTTLLVMITVFMGISISSCTHKSGRMSRAQRDSVNVNAAIKQMSNPTVSSIEDAVNLQQDALSAYTEDSIFRSMSQTSLKSVVIVLLNKQTTVTRKDIIDEYRLNKNVYDNLNPIPPKHEVIKTEETDSSSSYKIEQL